MDYVFLGIGLAALGGSVVGQFFSLNEQHAAERRDLALTGIGFVLAAAIFKSISG